MRLAIAALLLTLVSLPSRANLITNGSFESGPSDFNGWGFVSLNAIDTSVSGWTLASGSMDYVGPYWQAAHGNRSLDLSGTYFQGTIYQTIATTPGRPYVVTFALAGNPDVQPRLTTIRVWIDDPGTGPYADFNYWVEGQTPANMGWVYRSWSFTAASTTTILGFTSLDPYYDEQWGYSFGPALDDVAVEAAIPEPGSLALMGLGLLTLGFLRRRV